MTLTTEQHRILSTLQQHGRIFRSPRGFELYSPFRSLGTEELRGGTVAALLRAKMITPNEVYGLDHCIYELSAAGEQALAAGASATPTAARQAATGGGQ